MGQLARNLALAGPTIALLTTIATTGLSRAYPGDVFTVGSPIEKPSAPKPVEIPSGAYGVSAQTGAAEYTFNVPLPPGRGGMAPTVALRYSSQNPMRGGVAAGWVLDVPRIEYDTDASILQKHEFKSSLAGGQRLVPVEEPVFGGSPPPDVRTYRARSDSDFVRYEWHGVSPGYWIARHPNGTTFTFGQSPGARDEHVLSGRWMLDRVEDAHHNSIVYHWDAEHTLAYRRGQTQPFAADVRLLDIEYTFNDPAGLGAHARVEFSYAAGSVCAPSTIPVGSEFTFRYGYPLYRGAARLATIKVYSRASATAAFQLRRIVDFGYDTAAAACNQPRGPLRLLKTIDQRVWADGSATAEILPTITFGYGTPTVRVPTEAPGQGIPDLGGGLRHLDPRESGGWPAVTSMLLDVDGDSFVDLVKPRYGGENSCETATNYSESGAFASAVYGAWPQRLWQDDDPDPNEEKDASGNWLRGAEGCNLAYQLDRRQNVFFDDVGHCSSVSANYTSFRLVDITGDQIPELLTAVDSKRGTYVVGDPHRFGDFPDRYDPMVYPSGPPACDLDCLDFFGEPGPCLPCRNSANLEIRCSETDPLIPTVQPPADPVPGTPGSCGCSLGTCPDSSCVDAEGNCSCGSPTPEDHCSSSCPDSQSAEFIDSVLQRGEQGADGVGLWWQKFFPGDWGHESVTPPHWNPTCEYENETYCGRYVWRVRQYDRDPAFRNWSGAQSIPARIDAPVPLESYRPTGSGLVSAFRGLVDIDGDRCADAIYWIPFNVDTQSSSLWKTAVQVFRGDCQGAFNSTFTPGDINPDPHRWPIPSGVPNRLESGFTHSLPSPDNEQTRVSAQLTSLFDVNGDGLLDFVEGSGTDPVVRVYYSTGRGFETSPTELTTGEIGSIGREESVVLARDEVTGQMREGWSINTIRPIDFDADGLVDVAQLAPPVYDEDITNPWAQTDKSVRLHVNVGDALLPYASTTQTEAWWSGLARITMSNDTFWGVETDVIDLNGDGLFDLGGFTDLPPEEMSTGCKSGKSPLTCSLTNVGRDLGDATGQSVRLLRSIDTGRGAVIEFDYGSSGERTGSDPLVITNEGRMPQPAWLVRAMTVTPAPGSEPAVTNFRYAKPTFNADRDGKWAFRGFGGVTTWEPTNEDGARRRLFRRYSYLLDYSGRPFQTTVWDGDRIQTMEQTIWAQGVLFGGQVESFHPVITRRYTCSSATGGGSLAMLSSVGKPGGATPDDTPADIIDDPYAPEGTGGFGGALMVSAPGGGAASLLGGALTEEDCLATGLLERTTRRFVSRSATQLSYSAADLGLDIPTNGGVHVIPIDSAPVLFVQRGERLTDTPHVANEPQAAPEDRGWIFGESILYSQNRYQVLPTDSRKFRAVSSAWPGAELSGRSQTVYDGAGLGLPEVTRVWHSPNEYAETTRTFDTQTGNVLTSTEPSGLVTTTTYDAWKLFPATVTPIIAGASPPNLTVTYIHDVHTGQVTRQEGPAQPGKATVPVIETTYDGEGRVSQVRRSFDSGTSYVTDAVKTITYFDHLSDPLPHRIHVEELINRTSQTWIRRDTNIDGLGRPMAESVQLESGVATTSYSYDPAGNVISVAMPSPTGSGTAEYTYRHDALGRVTLAEQPGTPGYWTFEYDGARAIRTQMDGEDLPVSTSILDSDAFGRLSFVTELRPGEMPSEAIWGYTYDPNDNMKGIVDADQIATAMTHDFVGHRKTVRRDDTGGTPRFWEYDYDLAGNLVAEIMPFDETLDVADFTSTWAYDELGRVTSRRTASRGMTGPDVSRYFPASTGPGALYTYHTYDQAGHGSGVGRLTHVELPFGSIDYDYTVEGLVSDEERTFTIAPDGVPFTDTRSNNVTYNALGQPVRIRHADTNSQPGDAGLATVTRTTYDERGLPLYINRLVDVNGQTTTTLLARVTRNAAGVPTDRYSAFDQGQAWGYDALGRVTSNSIRSCTAGPVSQTTSRTCATAGTTVGGEMIGYYDSGDVESIQDPFTGATIRYTFDSQHQIINATTTAGEIYDADITYTPAGRVLTADVASPNPAVESRAVDHSYEPVPGAPADPHAVRRLIDQSTQNTVGVLDYDLTGNLVHKTWNPGGPPANGQNHDFIHDGDNQLREVINHKQSGDVNEVYFYDHSGQRMLAYTSPDGSTPARLRLWFGQTEIEYSVATTPIQPTKTEVFAGLGAMPAARILRGPTTSPSNAQVNLLYGGVLGSLLTVVGTTSDPVNHNLLARYSYGPFGELISNAGSEVGKFHRLFNGKEHDELTSLSYYGYRIYDRLTLTWTQADPLYRFVPDLAWDEPRRANLYGFSLNNPLKYYDPDGRDPNNPNDPDYEPDWEPVEEEAKKPENQYPYSEVYRDTLLEGPNCSSAQCNEMKDGGPTKTTFQLKLLAIGAGLWGLAQAGVGAGLLDAGGSAGPALALPQGGALAVGGATVGAKSLGAGLTAISILLSQAKGGSGVGGSGGSGARPRAGAELSKAEVKGLRELFGNNVKGAQRLLGRLRAGESVPLPKGVTNQTLQAYRGLAEKAISAGKDKLGVQALRREALDILLKGGP